MAGGAKPGPDVFERERLEQKHLIHQGLTARRLDKENLHDNLLLEYIL
jgi:hypothetical protein